MILREVLQGREQTGAREENQACKRVGILVPSAGYVVPELMGTLKDLKENYDVFKKKNQKLKLADIIYFENSLSRT